MITQTHVPSRRTVLAGALGLSALGSAAAAGPAAAALGDPAIPSDPDDAYFLSIPGIPGEATTKGFEGQIELLTWAWGVDAPAVIGGGGGGGGAGKATSREVITLADSGIQSPTLLLDTNTGRHLTTALLSCVRKPKKPFTFMTLKFDDVLVTSYAVTPDPTNGLPLDLVRLAFGKVTYTVIPQNADGTPGTPVSSVFDYGKNQAS